MNVEYLIQLLNNKLIVLKNAKILAYNNGDLSSINSLDEEIIGVENTLNQLKLLLTIDTVAASANLTSTEVVNSGIEAVQNITETPVTQGPSASAIINGYDISAYATDALHEQKIQSIVNAIPALVTVGDVDNYIKNITPDSPLTGSMFATASKLYNVEIPLMLAIIQNDSSFGTLGVGARTFNPGNVGNTGYAERSYGSWQEGVNAVSEWLNSHRVSEMVALTPLATTDPVLEQPVTPDNTPLPVVEPETELEPEEETDLNDSAEEESSNEDTEPEQINNNTNEEIVSNIDNTVASTTPNVSLPGTDVSTSTLPTTPILETGVSTSTDSILNSTSTLPIVDNINLPEATTTPNILDTASTTSVLPEIEVPADSTVPVSTSTPAV